VTNQNKKLALCVGINDYPGRDNDLKGCVNDARDWAKELKRRGFEVNQLLDQAATRENIVAGLRTMLEAAGSGDVAVFTFSGHGTWQIDRDGEEDDGRDEALCPYDVKQKELLVDDALYDLVQEHRKHGTRLIFLSDSCHSGSVTKSFREPGDTPKVRYMSPDEFTTEKEELTRMKAARRAPSRKPSRAGAVLISGCADLEFSYDTSFSGRANGAFTRVALDILEKEEPATYVGWVSAIRKRLPSNSYPQTPQLVATATQRKWKVFRTSSDD
jgi:metacaspase-1